MIIELKPYSSKPIYEQLILEIKRGIATSELAPGEVLPSVRSLASDIGVNMHTINKVYKHLEQEGVLVKQKNGFAVPSHKLKQSREAHNKMQDLVYELAIEKALYGLSDKDILEMIKQLKIEGEEN